MKRTIVFYDGHCSLCVGITGWLGRIEHNERFLLKPYQDTDFVKHFRNLTPQMLEKQLHIITENGQILKGADAVFEIWKKTGHWSGFLAYLFDIPPFIWLARPVYNLVSKYRKKLFGRV